jgi:hypothetical protein
MVAQYGLLRRARTLQWDAIDRQRKRTARPTGHLSLSLLGEQGKAVTRFLLSTVRPGLGTTS